MAIRTALKSSNVNLPEGRVISSLAYKMQNKGPDNSSLALKVLRANSFPASQRFSKSSDPTDYECPPAYVFYNRYVRAVMVIYWQHRAELHYNYKSDRCCRANSRTLKLLLLVYHHYHPTKRWTLPVRHSCLPSPSAPSLPDPTTSDILMKRIPGIENKILQI